MAVLDIVLLVLFIPAIVRGILKGFIEQIFALVTILLGGKLAFLFADKLGQWLGSYIHVGSTVLYIIAFVLIIICAVLLFRLCSVLITKLAQSLSLGWLNRILGFIIAILNTALILGLIFSVFVDLNDKIFHASTQFLSDSTIYGWIDSLTDFIFPKIEELFSSNAADGLQA